MEPRRPELDETIPPEEIESSKRAAWALEKRTVQNPLLRAFIGCSNLMQGALESNYAILHCSPERLRQIWGRLLEVSRLIRTEIAPLLDRDSCVETLDEARKAGGLYLEMVDRTTLAELDQFGETVPDDALTQLRKTLCVAVGKLQAFLQDSLGQLMAADPRGGRDADYFLSRQFANDVEEAEWLFASVLGLEEHLEAIDADRSACLGAMVGWIARHRTLPPASIWRATDLFLSRLLAELLPKIRELLAMTGIRVHEIEILERFAAELPDRCKLALEAERIGRAIDRRLATIEGPTMAEKQQSERDATAIHAVIATRLVQHLADLDAGLTDLAAFVPLWRDGVSNRRALLFKSRGER